MTYEGYKLEKECKVLEIDEVMFNGVEALKQYLKRYNLNDERLLNKSSRFIVEVIYNV